MKDIFIKCEDCGELGVSIPDSFEVGDIIECDNCAAEYEIVSKDPFQIRLIIEEK